MNTAETKKRSYVINASSLKDGKFVIPVIDVRDGETERSRVAKMQKASNVSRGSKFMRPSFTAMGHCYQNSFKDFDKMPSE